MKTRIIICLLISFFSISIFGKEIGAVTIDGKSAHPSRILVRYKNEANLASHEAQLRAAGVIKKEKLKLVDGLYVFEIENNVTNETELSKRLVDKIEALKQTGLFDYVEPDWIKKAHLQPSDAAFTDGRLWGLRNYGQNGGVAGADINAVAAWDITTGSPSVIVAIIDSGIRYTHEDLAQNMWQNPNEVPNNNIDDDGDGYVDDIYGINAITSTGNPMDDDGHGTHIAGIIGAVANNGRPNVGVAWKVKLMALKFLDANGGGKISDEIKCIDYAIAKGARIINMSFGDNAYSQAEFDALKKAMDNGILVVASAGNESVNNDSIPTYPASYNLGNIISVAALNRYNQLADFSNYGSNSVHIAAPGDSIFSCWNGSDQDYKTVSGTSMAAPYVSGVAALVLSAYPDIGVTQLRSQILNSGTVVQSLSGKVSTGARLDAYRALNVFGDGILEITISPENGSIIPAGRTIPITVKITDLYPVTNATVTATAGTGSAYNFSYTGSNGIYVASIQIPVYQGNFSLTLSATAPGKVSTNLTVVYKIAMPPANDDFYKNQYVGNGTNITLTAINTLATKQPGEPDHAGNSGGKSVWWTWTAPANGITIVSTDGSDFDTLLAVYMGNVITNLSLVAANDDYGQNNQPKTSRVNFYAISNTTYNIVVDGYAGDSGNINLTINLLLGATPPVNDNFANSITLSGQNITIRGTNIGATYEVNEPAHAGRRPEASVWYSWTAPFTGQVSIDTLGSDFDTILAVYYGNSLSSLSEVASNDDISDTEYSSKVIFNVTNGITYRIVVAGYNGACGGFYLSINKMQGGSGAPNDMFANAILIPQNTTQVIGSNRDATKEPGEPNHAGNIGGSSVWWKWIAPSNTVVVVSTDGSDFDTLLAVYTGSSVQNLTLVGENDDESSGGYTSQVVFSAISNQVYYIAVDGYARTNTAAEQGTIILTIKPVPPPANDNFENRIALTGVIVTADGQNYGATAQTSEPAHAGYNAKKSVWWSWTAPKDGYVMISTEGSSFDTILGVYTGNTLSQLTAIAGSDDSLDGSLSAKVYFKAVAGTTYHIAVDGYNGASGTIKLKIAQNYSSTQNYFTGFTTGEGFTVGRQVAGIGGWQCNFSGGNGILANRFPNKDQQAYIGYSPNYGSSGSVFLWRPLNITPRTNSIIVFSALMSIKDSTDGYYDTFGWSVYNSEQEPLFSIYFDNYTMGVYYALDDGQGMQSAGMNHENDTIYTVTILMNFASNTWAAYLGNVPIIEGKAITTKGSKLDLGDIDACWLWQDVMSGDNMMIFDDYSVETITEQKPPSILTNPVSLVVNEGENVVMSVVADGAQPLYYQWYFNSIPIAGATSATLPLVKVATNQAGIYSVSVSNIYGIVYSEPATLIVNKIIPPPANDNFTNAITITGLTVNTGGVNYGATREPNEPYHCGNLGGKSVWWRWIAPVSGKFTVTTIGSDFDTLLAIYTGSSINNLNPVAYNDDAQLGIRTSWLTFNATSNTTYFIAVDGFNGSSGNIVLAIKPDSSPKISGATLSQNREFKLKINGEAGLNFVIQYSYDLINWNYLTNLFNMSGTFEIIDNDLNYQRKFYRVVQ